MWKSLRDLEIKHLPKTDIIEAAELEMINLEFSNFQIINKEVAWKKKSESLSPNSSEFIVSDFVYI